MRSYPFLAASFILSSPLSVDAVLNHQPGTFLSSSDLESLKDLVLKGEDVIVLRDGTQLKGSIQDLPQLNFKYGNFPLNIQDIAFLAFSSKGGTPKMQVVSREGYVYVCDLPAERIGLVQYFPSPSSRAHKVCQEIEPRTISHVILQERDSKRAPLPRNHFALELKNGDQMPVIILDREIAISNGWSDFPIKTQDLVDISYDGGISGIIRDSEGSEKEMGLVFVKGKELKVQLSQGNKRLEIPWSQVARIKAVTPKGISAGDPYAEEIAIDSCRDFGSQAALEAVAAKSQRTSEIALDTCRNFGPEGALGATAAKPKTPPPAETAKGQFHEKRDETEKWKRISEALRRENQDLKFKVRALDESRKEFLREQDSLVANLELEFTRTYVLRNALIDLMDRWTKLKDYTQSLLDKMHAMKRGQKQTGMGEAEKAQVLKELQRLKSSLVEQMQLTSEFDRELASFKHQMSHERQVHYETNSALQEYFGKANAYKNDLDSVNQAFDQFREEKHKSLDQACQEAEGLRQALIDEQEMMEALRWQWEEERERLVRKHEHELNELHENIRLKAREIEELKLSKQERHTAFSDQIDQLTRERENHEGYQMELEAIVQRLLVSVEEEKYRARHLESQLDWMSKKAGALEEQYRLFQQEMANKWEEVEAIDAIEKGFQHSLKREIGELREINHWISQQKLDLEESVLLLQDTLENEHAKSRLLERELAHLADENEEWQEVAMFYQGMAQKLNEERAKLLSESGIQLDYQMELEAVVQKLLGALDEEKMRGRRMERELMHAVDGRESEKSALEKKILALELQIEDEAFHQDRLMAELGLAARDAGQYRDLSLELEGLVKELHQEIQASQQAKLAKEAEFSQKEQALQLEIAALKEKIRISLGAHAKLEDALNDSNRDLTELERAKGLAEAEIGMVRAALAGREAELESLKDEFAFKSLEFQEFAENTAVQLESLSIKLTDLFREMEAKERQTATLAEALEKSEMTNRLLEKELLAQKDALEEQERRSSGEAAHIAAAMDLLQEELFQEKNQVLMLAQKLELREREHAQADFLNDALEKELVETERKLKAVERELSEQKLAFLAQDRKIQDLEIGNERAAKSLGGELEQMKASLEEKGAYILELEVERDRLLASKELAEAHVLNLQRQLVDAKGLLAPLQNELKAANESLASKQSEMDALTLSFEAINRNILDEHAFLLKQYQEEMEKVDSLKTHLTGLLPKYEAEREKSFQFQNLLEKANSDLAYARNAAAISEQQNVSAKEKLNAVVKENTKLMQERDLLALQIQKDKEELAQQKEVVRKLTESFNSQKAALGKIEKTHLNLVSEFESARAQHNLILKDLSQENSRDSSYSPPATPKKTGKPANFGYRDIHIVAEGENLNNISMKYYGTPYRWSDIYEANEGVIQDVNRIKVGTALVIPE